MHLRLRLMASAITLSGAILGCAAVASPSVPSGSPGAGPTSSAGPTSTETSSTPPASAGDTASPPPIGCLGPLPELAAIVALDPGQRLACFGRRALAFQAVVVEATVDCAPVQVQPAWLWCPPTAFLAAPGTAVSRPGATRGVWADGSLPADHGLTFAAARVPMLEIHAPPGSGLDRPQPAGARVQVIGHFDDPAAAGCRLIRAQPGMRPPTPQEVVLACREAFVVIAVGPGTT
jgi:hypothetical protein